MDDQELVNIYTRLSNVRIKHYPITTKLIAVNSLTRKIKKFIFKVPKKIAKASRPGQFLMIWIPSVDEIPISIADVNGNEISVIVAAVGDATKRMHEMKKGDLLGIRGPYGNGFNLEKYERMIFVAGGYGVAPLLFAAKVASKQGKDVHFVFGAKSINDLFLRDTIEKYSSQVTYTTEDGSFGIKGTVINALKRLNLKEYDVCLICGPEGMIKSVFEICKATNIEVQASLERFMKCGFGICGTCAIGPYLVCKDGPVFSTNRLKVIEKFW
ncbi:MAG: dihydroorotate dehydrogenase electron transfer subunit [Candidatus Asgardarchaeia archaeon]